MLGLYQWFRKRKRLILKFLFFFAFVLLLDCRLTGALSAAEFVAASASPSPEETTELPIPDSEVTRSNSAAKIASLFEIRDCGCLFNRNIFFSSSVVVKYNTTTAKCKYCYFRPAGLFAGLAHCYRVAAEPGQG